MGHRRDRTDGVDAAMVEDFLELGGGFRAIVELQIGEAARVENAIGAKAVPGLVS